MALVNIREGYKPLAWFTANPTLVLLSGQRVNLDTQQGIYKIGDGVTQLSALNFLGTPYTLTTAEIGGVINGASSATPNDTDLVMSVDTSVAKKNTWTQIKSFLKTYFDTVYTTTSAVASQITTALSGYATQSWVTSQGYITNVITALGYTPENVANKATDWTTINDTLYPTVKNVDTQIKGVITASLSFFYYKIVSDIGTYYKMLQTPSTGIAQSIVKTNTTGTTSIAKFITEPSQPNKLYIPIGWNRIHLHAEKTGAGNVTLFAKIFKRDLGGTETVLFTTVSILTNLTTSNLAYDLEYYNTGIATLLATDRIGVEILSVTATGTPDVTIWIEDAFLSRVDLPSASSDLSGYELTANKDATGGYAGLTLFKINFKNVANTFTSFFTNSNTVSRTYTFQDRNGTIADDTDLAGKQATLVSATNIKTVNSNSLLGSGNVSVGTILGSVGATTGLIPLGNGTSNTVTTSVNLVYTESATNSFMTIGGTSNTIPLFVTNREVIVTAFNTDYDPNIVSARTIADSIITNSHGFVEATVFKSTTSNLANNAFTDNGILRDPTGVAGNYNHHASYQSQVKLNNTGTTGSLYFCADAPTVNSGTLTNRYGFYFYDGVGTGTIVNQYGLYVPTLAKGSTINEAIHVATNDSYFGGKLKMVTTSGAANVEAPQLSWYHASTIKTSYITDKIINNTSELKFNVSTYNFGGYKEMLTLRGDDNNTNSDYAIINSTKLGLYNVTPVIRATTSGTASAFVSNTSLIANDTATFDGYTIGQVVKSLRNLGILT